MKPFRLKLFFPIGQKSDGDRVVSEGTHGRRFQNRRLDRAHSAGHDAADGNGTFIVLISARIVLKKVLLRINPELSEQFLRLFSDSLQITQ